MIILLTGASHTGKTAVAQRLLEKYRFPYLSIDHLKMGLIRSGNTSLTPVSDKNALTEYLWPIVCEMIKTAIENGQNLIVEGCYIPIDWRKYFDRKYLDYIRFFCIVMSEDYINEHFTDIKSFAGIIEDRGDDEGCTLESVLKENDEILKMCQEYNSNYILIKKLYSMNIILYRVIKEIDAAKIDLFKLKRNAK